MAYSFGVYPPSALKRQQRTSYGNGGVIHPPLFEDNICKLVFDHLHEYVLNSLSWAELIFVGTVTTGSRGIFFLAP